MFRLFVVVVAEYALLKVILTLFTCDGMSHLLFSMVHVTESRIRTPVSTAYNTAPT